MVLRKWQISNETIQLYSRIIRRSTITCFYFDWYIFDFPPFSSKIDEVESLSTSRQQSMSGSEPSDAVRVVNALLTQVHSSLIGSMH